MGMLKEALIRVEEARLRRHPERPSDRVVASRRWPFYERGEASLPPQDRSEVPVGVGVGAVEPACGLRRSEVGASGVVGPDEC